MANPSSHPPWEGWWPASNPRSVCLDHHDGRPGDGHHLLKGPISTECLLCRKWLHVWQTSLCHPKSRPHCHLKWPLDLLCHLRQPHQTARECYHTPTIHRIQCHRPECHWTMKPSVVPSSWTAPVHFDPVRQRHRQKDSEVQENQSVSQGANGQLPTDWYVLSHRPGWVLWTDLGWSYREEHDDAKRSHLRLEDNDEGSVAL